MGEEELLNSHCGSVDASATHTPSSIILAFPEYPALPLGVDVGHDETAFAATMGASGSCVLCPNSLGWYKSGKNACLPAISGAE
jgi:hypothetical protein